MSIEIVLPKGALGGSEYDTRLDTFLRNFASKHKIDGDWVEKYGVDLRNDNVVMKPYCWCEKSACPYCFDFEENHPSPEMKSVYGIEDDRTAPNFWYKPLDFKVWWYKYIGRSVEVNMQLSQDEFRKMVDDCLEIKRIER